MNRTIADEAKITNKDPKVFCTIFLKSIISHIPSSAITVKNRTRIISAYDTIFLIELAIVKSFYFIINSITVLILIKII